MCVIAIKTKGVQFPSVEDIQNCCDRNPDGFAMAWNQNGKLNTYKTMSKVAFIKKYKEVVASCSAKQTAMVVHARIATHGSKGLKNCHCWTGSGLAFAHNGILTLKNRGDMTDSETFFRDIFEPIFNAGGWKPATLAIKSVIGGSKFAFLDKDGNVHMFGFYEKHDGCFYSNSSWQGFVQRFYGGKSLIKIGGDAQPRFRFRDDDYFDFLSRGGYND